MVRPPCFDRKGMKKGAWSKEEDNILRAHIEQFGHPNWRLLPLLAGLARCGKSCRLRWVNYLKPGLKRGKLTKHEEDLIIKLHKQLGNKWSAIAAKLPGRTDNEIKNYWHGHIKKRGRQHTVFTNVIKDYQMPQEDQSSEINSCITTDNYQDEERAENHKNIDALNWVADSYSVAEPYQAACFTQLSIDLPLFLDENFDDFGLCQNHDMPTFSDSSDGGSTSWNSTAKSQENFWSGPLGEDAFDIVLW